jgi:glycosyltransferase involved in cell wall biosynthesis
VSAEPSAALGMAQLAYVTPGFPDLTQSFVRREVEQVRAFGVPLVVCSLRPPPRRLGDPELARYIETTIYGSWLFSLALVRAHLHFLRRAPGRYFGALGATVRLALRQLAHPRLAVATLAIFPKSVYFARVLEARGVTHVHAHFANHPTTAAATMARLLGVPFSFTGHAWDIFVPANQIGLAEKIAAARAVVTCTRYNERLLQELAVLGGAEKVAVSYHGVALASVAVAAREPGLVVSVGRLTQKKGFHDLVAACELLARDGVAFRCVVVGEGEERETLTARIHAAGLDGRVELAGAMPHRAVMELIAKASVFTLPSVRARDASMDGIPNVILEAFSVGTPVVSTSLSGIPEVVRDGETGTLVAPGDSVALAAALRDALRRPEVHLDRAQRGRDLVASSFDLGRNVRALLAWIGVA